MHMTQLHGVAIRNVSGLLVVALALGAAPSLKHATAPVQITVKLSEWKVELSQASVAAGTVTFAITNARSIPHGFEVEGHGIEKEIEVIQPGASDTLTLTLEPATYEVYCPVGEDSHKKLGMETHLKVVGARSSGSSGYGESAMGETHEARATVQSIRVTGGGPVINSAVALWAFGHLYKNDQLVTDNAMVHVMLLSRTRRDGDFALACWDCSKNKIDELQLQILPGPGEPKLAAPGGFLFVNWEKSSSRQPASGGESNALTPCGLRLDR